MSEAPRDPMRAAQANMRPTTVKRFYRTVDVGEATGGRHALTLDGRNARTPGRNPLAAKSRALMLKVAAEWERQRETVDPADMPLTRLLNSAVDGVSRRNARDQTLLSTKRLNGDRALLYSRKSDPNRAFRTAQGFAFDPGVG